MKNVIALGKLIGLLLFCLSLLLSIFKLFSITCVIFSFAAALDHVVEFCSPNDLLSLLPPSGTLPFFLPFIERSCKLHFSKQLALPTQAHTSVKLLTAYQLHNLVFCLFLWLCVFLSISTCMCNLVVIAVLSCCF